MISGRIKYFVEILVVIGLFVLFSYIVQSNIEFFEGIIDFSFWGMFVYVLVVIIAVVIAPISTMPLLPVASNLWGWFLADPTPRYFLFLETFLPVLTERTL